MSIEPILYWLVGGKLLLPKTKAGQDSNPCFLPFRSSDFNPQPSLGQCLSREILPRMSNYRLTFRSGEETYISWCYKTTCVTVF